MYAIAKHMQVVTESPESIARREIHPRARRRYLAFCTCSMRRNANGSCPHLAALMQDNIRPERWKDITFSDMPAKHAKTGGVERPRADLERELAQLRERVKELEAVAA